MSDDWVRLGHDFADYTKESGAYGLDNNPFIATDQALGRLQEAMLERDPIAYLNKEYRYSLPADSEYGVRLKEMAQRIKSLPSLYFETKFRRPVYLNEFAAAVVPQELPQELKDGLQQSGLRLYAYDPQAKGSRREATLQATQDDGIRFSVRYNPATDKSLLPSASKEMVQIKERAQADGTFMQAPNGEPTRLTEKQWLQVRTENFKRWFGDWENDAKKVNIVRAEKEHGFANFDDARRWAKANIVGDVQQSEIGTINISGKAIEKYLSEKAVDKSTNKDVHLSALRVLPQVIENSIVGDIHDDRDKDPNIQDIVRLFGCINITGQNHRVKTTVKRYTNSEKSKAYSYEVTEIELLEGLSATTHTQSADFVPTSNNSISAAKLLKNIETTKQKGKKNAEEHDFSQILDENGEPLVVKHGTPYTFHSFDVGKQQQNDAGWLGTGFYFYGKNDVYAAGYARGGRVISAFLNIRNPYYATYEEMERLAELNDKEESRRFTEELIEEGYDGVYYDGDLNGECVAFSPDQIKSATDNDGSFSGNSDDIRFSIRGRKGDIFFSNAERVVFSVRGAKERRLLNEDEKAVAREKLTKTKPIEAEVGVIKGDSETSVRKAAEQWAEENIPEPLHYQTEAGDVIIGKTSVKNSLAHGYNQAKLDAIPTLPEGFNGATYLGSMDDFDGQPVENHYFAYPINYNGELCYVFCRARKDVNTNRLYVHEVFTSDKMKSSTLQTAAKLLRSKPHRGAALYREILSDILSNGKVTTNFSNTQEKSEKSEKNAFSGENVRFSIRKEPAPRSDGRNGLTITNVSRKEIAKAMDSKLVKGWLKYKNGGDRNILNFGVAPELIRQMARARLGITNKYHLSDGISYQAAEELGHIINYAKEHGLAPSISEKYDLHDGEVIKRMVDSNEPIYTDAEVEAILKAVPIKGVRDALEGVMQAFAEANSIEEEMERIILDSTPEELARFLREIYNCNKYYDYLLEGRNEYEKAAGFEALADEILAHGIQICYRAKPGADLGQELCRYGITNETVIQEIYDEIERHRRERVYLRSHSLQGKVDIPHIRSNQETSGQVGRDTVRQPENATKRRNSSGSERVGVSGGELERLRDLDIGRDG